MQLSVDFVNLTKFHHAPVYLRIGRYALGYISVYASYATENAWINTHQTMVKCEGGGGGGGGGGGNLIFFQNH